MTQITPFDSLRQTEPEGNETGVDRVFALDQGFFN
jgi:hypothetical protein